MHNKNEDSFKFMNLYEGEKTIGELIKNHGLNFESSVSNLSAVQREKFFEFEMVFLELNGKSEHVEVI